MSIDPTQDPTQPAATDAPSADIPPASDVAAEPAAEPAALVTPAEPAEQADPAEPAPEDDAAADAPVEASAPVDGAEAAKPGLSPAECARELAQRFPALFDGPAKPLKLRIQADIQVRAPGVFSRSVLSAFLRRLTGSTAYLNALSRAPARLDLDGQPAGEISDEHRNLALEELARRRALRNERRVAEGGAPDPRGPRGPRPSAADGSAPEGAPAAARPPRGPRPPREGAPREGAPREGAPREGAPRGERRDRPPRPEGTRPEGARPEGARADAPRRDGRGPRPEGRPAGRPDARGDRRPNDRNGDRNSDRPPQRHGDGPRPDRRPDPRAEHRADPRAEKRPEAAEARIEDPERRQRARLLREWESTSLTRANFCVLRGVPEAQFDALLEQARAEARAHGGGHAPSGPRGERPAKPRP